MTFGLACCARGNDARWSRGATTLDRFGVIFRLSPSACRTGRSGQASQATRWLSRLVVKVYDQMAEPRWEISMGSCATGGGYYHYCVLAGAWLRPHVPVDIDVPGRPPTAEALICWRDPAPEQDQAYQHHRAQGLTWRITWITLKAALEKVLGKRVQSLDRSGWRADADRQGR